MYSPTRNCSRCWCLISSLTPDSSGGGVMSDLKAQKGRSHVQTSLLLPRHRDSTNVDNCSNDKKQEHSAVRRLLSWPNTTKFEPLLAHFHMTKEDVGSGIEFTWRLYNVWYYTYIQHVNIMTYITITTSLTNTAVFTLKTLMTFPTWMTWLTAKGTSAKLVKGWEKTSFRR